ncbi:hypothetical protein [Streptomyces sp. NRRL S-813]|uniref:hypothetical protein n=1 Tax=Streptomyces sp. NRRL S-813 TaxID=1463919 RepID=UPI0004C09474|nr:hypothetical protein [Streptomyces sp. NRRL S-813]
MSGCPLQRIILTQYELRAPDQVVEDDLSAVIEALEAAGWKLEQVTPFVWQDHGLPLFRALVVFRA